ncbi:conserved hypothetical protein [Candida tropicalis MYA-3404]|uniref:Uncharacterized protein n=1 Tax=Candida tropicalis (strain ATCC MYA-3404 / T1) TaxID=294747 RepID=C5M3J7_CANTT|nr:conserved hypothetical protein [Candida tropicalis MYA-3404]EER35897.1 conserved hypothetical protein [Candida tropicalis MYA-3404]KAG4410013.1 hypothetical protein JTP64_000651 [Candida tropicalis]
MNGDHHHHHHHHHHHSANNPNNLHLQFFSVPQDPIPTNALDTSSLVVNRVTMNPLVEPPSNHTVPTTTTTVTSTTASATLSNTVGADVKEFEDDDEDDKYSEDKLDPIAFAIRNRKFKAELTPDERGYIIGRSVSTSIQELSKELKMSRSTIQHTLKMCRQRKHNKTLNQNRGRKLAISPEEMEEVFKLLDDKPNMSKQEVIAILNLKVSPRTLSRALQRNGNRKGTQRK